MDSPTLSLSWPASAELGNKVFLDPARLSADSKPICAAIGVFDGVHHGHQRVLDQAVADSRRIHGKTLVLTFDKHPKEILSRENAPPMIYPLERRLAVLAEHCADAILLLRFDESLSRQSGEDFVRFLVSGLGNLRSLSVGNSFTFGYRRSGNLDLLKRLGAELGFEAHGVHPVMWQDKPISSTRIRQAIREGDFRSAEQMMGRPYFLEGTVVRGDQLGRQLGFPTANLDTGNLVYPPHGVYAVQVDLGSHTHPGVLNIGIRPTVRAGLRLQVEVHLLDFQADIYGERARIQFVSRLRPERKFSSLEQLKAQVMLDIAQARRIFQGADLREETP